MLAIRREMYYTENMNSKVIRRKELSDNQYITEYETGEQRWYAFHEEVPVGPYFMPRSKIFKANKFENFLEFEKFVWYGLILRYEDDDVWLSHPIYAATWIDCGKAVNEWLGKF